MRNIEFVPKVFKEYQNWIETDRKMALRIGDLIKDILRNPFEGLGKPEALKLPVQRILEQKNRPATSLDLHGHRHIHSYILLLLSLLLIKYLFFPIFIL